MGIKTYWNTLKKSKRIKEKKRKMNKGFKVVYKVPKYKNYSRTEKQLGFFTFLLTQTNHNPP